jgi:acyl-CoA synthetase (NDP forming)
MTDRHLPEHEVKALLARHGVAVPKGTIDLSRIDDLREPLVVKAYGRAIVHKSDRGLVELDVQRADVAKVAARFLQLEGVEGVLVEEQARPWHELLVGVVNGSFGPMLAVGMGGTQTELFDDVALRALPVDAADVRVMLDELRSAKLLHGYRGGPPTDLDALVSVVLGVCSLAEELGDELGELECNPVIAGPSGSIAVDARLTMREASGGGAVPRTDFTRLFAPRGIAVAGASATKQTFGNRFLEAYRAMGWTDNLAAIHPTATDIDGVPAYPSLHDVPHPVDYVLAAVPAAACADLVRDASGVAPFVHVISGGFSEASGRDGHDLEHRLVLAGREANVRVLGPNCMGVYAPAGRQTFQLDVPRRVGPASIVSQSGGLAGDIVKGGAARGITFAKLVTIGNAIDVTPGELCEWLVDDPDTGIVGIYVEDPRDGARLTRALHAASAAGKPAVVLVGGLSTQGSRAVASHTGALAGDRRVWQAVAAHTGCTLVATLEQLLDALAYLHTHADVAPPPDASRAPETLVVGMGGGASVLTTDACDRAGLRLGIVHDAVRATLLDMGYGAGTSVVNPIEIPFGPAAPPDAFRRVLTPILAVQHYRDVLVHVNVQAFFSYAADGGAKLVAVADAITDLRFPGTRVAFVARNLDVAPAVLAGELVDRCRELGVSLFRSADEAAVAIKAAQDADVSSMRRRASRTATSG